MPLPWRIRFYVSPRGEDKILEWYCNQQKAVQAKFVSKLKILRGLRRSEWKRPLIGVLDDECEGLWEIVLSGTPHRPLGFFIGEHAFVLVIGASKDGDRWIPNGACQTGLARKSEVLIDAARACDCPLHLE